MPGTPAAGRIAAALSDSVRTRLELAAVEVQQESRRLLGFLVQALLADFARTLGEAHEQ
jgi:uncharacterized membrane protein YqjE